MDIKEINEEGDVADSSSGCDQGCDNGDVASVTVMEHHDVSSDDGDSLRKTLAHHTLPGIFLILVAVR